MDADDFRKLLDAAGLNPTEAAERLGKGRTTIWRWLNNETPISKSAALLIRALIKPRKG